MISVTRTDVITLIGEDPKAHGVFDVPDLPRREVFCQVRSVGYYEFYRAAENNLHPTFIFQLADVAEYNNEKICEYQGVRYRVIRTYVDRQRIELTVEEATVDG